MVGFTGSAEDKLSWKKQTKQIDLHIIWVATEIVLNVNQWNIAWSRCLKEKRPDFYIKRFLTSPHFIWCFILSLWTRDWLCANSAQYRTSQLRFGRRWWRAEEQRSLWLWVCWCLCVPTRALPMSIRLLWCRRAHLAFCSSRRCKPGAEQELQAVLWGKRVETTELFCALCPVVLARGLLCMNRKPLSAHADPLKLVLKSSIALRPVPALSVSWVLPTLVYSEAVFFHWLFKKRVIQQTAVVCIHIKLNRSLKRFSCQVFIKVGFVLEW